MRKYKRLSNKDMERLKLYRDVGKKIGNIIKIVSGASVILVITGVAVTSFYTFIDNQHREEESDSSEVSEASKNVSGKINEYDYSEKLEGERNPGSYADNIDGGGKENKKEGPQSSGEINVSVSFSEWNKSCKRELMVVNKFNSVDVDYNVKTKICRGKEVSIEMADNLEKMILDARSDNIILWISSGYRNMELQQKLFDKQLNMEKLNGADDEKAELAAESVVARPGTSEHNIGLAVDFNGVEDNFYETKEYKWLVENAHRYGFIERYKEEWRSMTYVISEPWHFRYVGIDAAEKVKQSNMCLEEYISRVLMGKQGTGGIF